MNSTQDEAEARLRRDAQAGDPDALFQLAGWALTGEKGAVDLPLARELFLQSGEAGRFDAALIYVNLLANGTGGPAEWDKACVLLKRLAEHDPACADELDLIGRMELGDGGEPATVPQARQLSESPNVVLIPRLFTQQECDYLARLAQPMLQAAVVEESAGIYERHPGRTSDSVAITWPIETPAVHALNRRIARATGTDVAQGEPLQILRYRPGQEYKPHFDAIPGFDNQRILTCLVWLNAGYDGGETIFLDNGLEVKGDSGDALLFRNAGSDGIRDERSAHAGRPVTRGEKWLASRWIRQQPLK